MSSYIFVGAGLLLAAAVYFALQPVVVFLAVIGLIYSILVFLVLKSRKSIQTFSYEVPKHDKDGNLIFHEPTWFSVLWFICPVVVGLIVAIVAPVWISGVLLAFLGVFQWAAWQPISRKEAELRASHQ